ncbi:hypothetical protein HanPSC8_Chr13g0591871 [Helianthus annuus]|nr:hypothetical protein HanPSC8_Chr13g0591871 [Helianthus annuus]
MRNLFDPVDDHGPGTRALFQYFYISQHWVPLRSKFIIPEEISNQLGCRIFKHGSATVDNRASLMYK